MDTITLVDSEGYSKDAEPKDSVGQDGRTKRGMTFERPCTRTDIRKQEDQGNFP